MVWPFESDTSAIVKKMARRSVKSDQKCRFFLVFTIAISVCMILSILLITTGTQEAYKNTQRDKAQIAVVGANDEQLSALNQNQDVLWVGEYSLLGIYDYGSKTITVAYGNADYFHKQDDKKFQGNIPQKDDEVMLPQNYLDYFQETYQIGDTITLDLTGTGEQKHYTLSAILDDTSESDGYFIYVSKALAKELVENQLQITAYTRLNTDVITSGAILDFASGVMEKARIEEGQVNLTEYFAAMSGSIRTGLPLPVPLIAILTILLASSVIYGIFFTKITKNVRMFGQLRTIGMTKLQVKKMAKKEGFRYALWGIPFGITTGWVIGFVGCPDGFRINTTLFYTLIVVISAFLMVKVAIFKPVRIAMNTSPVEGAKYIVYAGKIKSNNKLHRKLTPTNLARINLKRNKRKAILTMAMLGLSGSLFLATATVAGSIDAEKQAAFRYYPNGNLHIRLKNTIGSSFDTQSEPYGSTKLQLENNPLVDEKLIERLQTIDGVEGIKPSNCIYATITFPAGSGSLTSITNFFPTLEREQMEAMQAVLSEGQADYEDMVSQNGILVADDTANQGDILTLEGRASDGNTFSVDVRVVGTFNRTELMEKSPIVPGSPYFIMAYDTAKQLTGVTEQTGILSIETGNTNLDAIRAEIQNIASEYRNIEIQSIEQTAQSVQRYYSPSIRTFYIISAILCVFGVISLLNMLIVDFQNRKREFGLLKAVGVTQGQLKRMLQREIQIYLGGSLATAVVGGSIFCGIVCSHLDRVNHCITLELPWFFLVGLLVTVILIYFIFILYAKSELKKTSILSAIRDE